MRFRIFRFVTFALAYIIAVSSFSLAENSEIQVKTETEKPLQDRSRTKEERLRELKLEKAEIRLKQMKVTMDEKKADHKAMKTLFDQGLVSVQEMNDAKKDMEDAILAYEEAKLELQVAELESLTAAWHITILDTRVRDEGDKKMMSITLVNTSEKVKLERTRKMIEDNIIEAVDIEVSPEINNIYVSIKEGENIISVPYEIYIQSLKLDEPKPLEFELIKDIEDVVVSMRYEGQEERRNIHLKKVEPHISVVKAAKYYTAKDERMIYVVLKNGAVEGEGETVKGKDSPIAKVSSKPDDEVSKPAKPTDDDLNDIKDIFVSIKDEQNSIIGIPYEIRIPVLKYNEQKGYKFELQKDANSVVVSMTYLKKENTKNVFLEPDTRHISILSAEVRQLSNTPDIEPERSGKKEVTLELVNTSDSGKMPFADELIEIAGSSVEATGEIRNIFVSIKHNGIVIAKPYEAEIERLGYDKPKKLKFVLQQLDVEDVTVALNYLGRIDEQNVYLEKVSPADEVTVNSVGFAQEGPLGESVDYDLTLERLAQAERIFKLRVANLPDQFTYRFNDTQAGTRVTQIKFTHAQSKRQLSLQVFLPEEMDLNLLDKPLDFYAVVLSEEQDANYKPGRLNLTEDELSKMKVGRVRLILTPKGVPEFELIAQNLYFEIKTDETVEMLLTLKNIGTRNLNDIRIDTILPNNKWDSDIRIVINPPLDVDVGATEVKIKAECEVDNVKIEAPEKNVRIEIVSKANIKGSVILIGALILLVVGIAVLTIRLSRR